MVMFSSKEKGFRWGYLHLFEGLLHRSKNKLVFPQRLEGGLTDEAVLNDSCTPGSYLKAWNLYM